MYPFFRFAWAVWRARHLPPLGIGQAHVSHHVIMPWDLDLWRELNNGRTLTIYDLGRFPLFIRSGIIGAMRKRGWGGTVAGVSVRYRRRVRGFDRVRMVSRVLGFDDRFVYIDQSMWRGAEAVSNALYRVAITGPDGIVPPELLAAETGQATVSPPLPDWVRAWIAAEAQRQWPPDSAPELRDNFLA